MLGLVCWLCLVRLVRSASCPDGMPIVSLQLKWLQQSQFGGYFAAQEQGFYFDECLNVNVRPGGPQIVAEDEVLQGRAQFGITWGSYAFDALNQNKSVTVVSQIFQRVGMKLVSFVGANIKTTQDFHGKKLCLGVGGAEADWWRSMFAQWNLTWDSDYRAGFTNPPNNSVDVVSLFSVNQYLSHQCDVAGAEVYNEYAQILLTQQSPGVLYTPPDFNVVPLGKTMFEDLIIASSAWLENPANQDIAVRFLRASYRGWMYARDNPMATVNLFADKTALQVWQMNEVNGLIWPAPLGIGVVSDEAMQQTADLAFEYGLTSRWWNASEFYRSDLALAAQQGIEGDVQGLSFQPRFLAFCLDRGNTEICDTSVESSTSFVDPMSTIGMVMIAITVLGLLFAGGCAALLIHSREEKVIRSAALPFSLLMCTGALIGLFSIFFYLGRPVDATCHARAWLLGVGFITFFGNFLVKVWRIHVIFSGKVLFKIKVSDSKLYLRLGVLVVLQVVLLALYSGLGSPVATRVVHSNDYTQFDTVCLTQQSDLWNLLLALYAASLLVYGVYLAIQVRHIQSLYSEAKLLGGSIYNVLFVAVVCGPILLFLDMPPTSVALVTALATVAMFCGSIAIVFVPRFLMIFGRPRFPASEHSNRQSRSDNSQNSLLIDGEAMKSQDKDQLIASREQAVHLKEQYSSLIKAIDAELDRRSRGSAINMTTVSSTQRPSTSHPTTSLGSRGERTDTRSSAETQRGKEPVPRENSCADAPVEHSCADRQNSRSEKQDE